MSELKRSQSVNEDFFIILHTIFNFLDSHNFKNTLLALKQECEDFGFKNLDEKKLCYANNETEKNIKIPIDFIESKSVEAIENGNKIIENSEKGILKVFHDHDDFEELNDEPHNENLTYTESEGTTPCQFDMVQSDFDHGGTIIKISRPSTTELTPLSTPDQNFRAPQNTPNTSLYMSNNRENDLKENSQNSAFQIVESQSQVTDLATEYDILKEKFFQLQDEHRRLMEITAKLTVAFQRNLKGQTESMNTILNSCLDICPEFFCAKEVLQTKSCYAIKKEQFTQYTQEIIDVKRKSSVTSNYSTDTFEEPAEPDEKQFESLPSEIPTNFQLDFHKIKNDLRNGDKNLKLALLQGLRWRVTRNPSCIRHEVIANYERFDLLDIRNCSHRIDSNFPKASKFLDNFYSPKKPPDILQESIARLINAIASMKIGRDYLTRQSILMNYLLSILLGTHNLKPKLDSVTRDMTIATMQKMSLRYWQRVTMINAGLCKFMVKFLLDNYKKLTSYCLEYSTALLMNLWLHVDAREQSRSMVKDVIKLLATLLDVKYENCLPYVNGALYSLLPDHTFHKIAKEVKLGQIIECRIPAADADMQDQLRCILKIYYDPTNWQPLCDCDLGVEIENEIDLFEPELDENDKFFTSGLSGEQLLYNYRLLFPINGSQVCATNVIWRPVTPSYQKRTSFSVSALSPYVKETNSYVIQDSYMGVNYQDLKEFFLTKLTEELLNNEIYFEETADNENNENEKKANKNRDNEQMAEKGGPNGDFKMKYSEKDNPNNFLDNSINVTKNHQVAQKNQQIESKSHHIVSKNPTDLKNKSVGTKSQKTPLKPPKTEIEPQKIGTKNPSKQKPNVESQQMASKPHQMVSKTQETITKPQIQRRFSRTPEKFEIEHNSDPNIEKIRSTLIVNENSFPNIENTSENVERFINELEGPHFHDSLTQTDQKGTEYPQGKKLNGTELNLEQNDSKITAQNLRRRSVNQKEPTETPRNIDQDPTESNLEQNDSKLVVQNRRKKSVYQTEPIESPRIFNRESAKPKLRSPEPNLNTSDIIAPLDLNPNGTNVKFLPQSRKGDIAKSESVEHLDNYHDFATNVDSTNILPKKAASDLKLVHKDSLELNKKSLDYKKLRENSFELTGGDTIRIEFDENFRIISEIRPSKSAENETKKIVTEDRMTKSSTGNSQKTISRIPRSKTVDSALGSTKVPTEKKAVKIKNDAKKSKNVAQKNHLNKKSVSELEEMTLDDIKNELSPKKMGIIPELPPQETLKREKSFQKDKNNNKSAPKHREQETYDRSDKYQNKPPKNDSLPSVAMKKRNSLPSSPSLNPLTGSRDLVYDNFKNSHPLTIHPNCYKQTYSKICYCNGSGPCDFSVQMNNARANGKINRYSCCCYDKLKESFDLDTDRSERSPGRHGHGNCNINCKYSNSKSYDGASFQNERVSSFSFFRRVPRLKIGICFYKNNPEKYRRISARISERHLFRCRKW